MSDKFRPTAAVPETIRSSSYVCSSSSSWASPESRAMPTAGSLRFPPSRRTLARNPLKVVVGGQPPSPNTTFIVAEPHHIWKTIKPEQGSLRRARPTAGSLGRTLAGNPLEKPEQGSLRFASRDISSSTRRDLPATRVSGNDLYKYIFANRAALRELPTILLYDILDLIRQVQVEKAKEEYQSVIDAIYGKPSTSQ